MGSLRHDEDAAYMHSIAEEVVDLFGTDDAVLYRFAPADNITTRDPLYDEPVEGETVHYKPFRTKAMFFSFTNNPFASEAGFYQETLTEGYVARKHLIGAGVLEDKDKELIAEGDVIEFHSRSQGRIFYNIVQSTRTGFINDAGNYTGYQLSLKRTTKFVPERLKLTT